MKNARSLILYMLIMLFILCFTAWLSSSIGNWASAGLAGLGILALFIVKRWNADDESDSKNSEPITAEVLLLAVLGGVGLWFIWGWYEWLCPSSLMCTPFCNMVELSPSRFITVLAPLATVPNVIFWWLRRDKHKGRELDNQDMRLLTDRYRQAAEMLGKRSTPVVLAGIYALEALAHDSWDYHWKVMETLSAFIREKTRIGKRKDGDPLPTEVQAALTVIGRRKKEFREREKGKRIDLSNCDLSGANLSGSGPDGPDGHFERVDFTSCIFHRSNLERCILDYAILEYCIMDEANLQYANFVGAWFFYSNFNMTKFQHARFNAAKLDYAEFTSVRGDYADFTGATMTQVVIRDCHLSGASFECSNLQMAFLDETIYSLEDPISFNKAKLEGAYLGVLSSLLNAENTWDGAIISYCTMFPDLFKHSHTNHDGCLGAAQKKPYNMKCEKEDTKKEDYSCLIDIELQAKKHVYLSIFNKYAF